MNNAPRRWTCTLLLAFTPACATVGPDHTGEAPPYRAALLAEKELGLTSGSNAYEVVQSLRPFWLRTRGISSVVLSQDIVVYVDDQKLGGSDALREIPRSWIASVEHLNGVQATQRFGTGNGNGAILISTKRGTRR